LEEGFEEALEIVREAEDEARDIIARLQRQPRQSKVTEEGRQRLAEMRRDAQRRLQQLRHERQERERQREEEIVEEEREPEPEAFQVHAGDRVHVPSLGRDGEVVQASEDGAVEVQVGNMTVETRAEELEPAHTQPSREAQEIHRRMQAQKSLSFDDEIDLRGMTVDEAITRLSKYLDDAMLAGADQVRIIHGKGTGALREGVHEYLRKHRYVSDFSLAEIGEGGSGATEVRL
ncbi:MAG: Smr/MutS family protein, partial [Armatimonadota bacterium]